MEQNGKKKSGYVALIGKPNVGKSTLMNHLIKEKVAITANKPQTTRNRIQTVYTDERGQVIFLDTPGIHKAKTKLGDFMVEEALKTIPDADVVLWLAEPLSSPGKNMEEVAAILSKSGKPTILVMNKIDLFPEEAVRETIRKYSETIEFTDVVEVSALRNVRVPKLLDRIFELLPEGPLYYDEDTLTNQPMRDIVAEMIREQALRDLSDEIPHGIAVTIEKMKQRKDGLWDVEATVHTEKESHKGIIIGKGGAMLKRIGTGARLSAEKMLGNRMNLKIHVKFSKNWRDSESVLRSFGYAEEKK